MVLAGHDAAATAISGPRCGFGDLTKKTKILEWGFVFARSFFFFFLNG